MPDFGNSDTSPTSTYSVQPSAQPIDPAIQQSAMQKIAKGASLADLQGPELQAISRMSPDQINAIKAKSIAPKIFKPSEVASAMPHFPPILGAQLADDISSPVLPKAPIAGWNSVSAPGPGKFGAALPVTAPAAPAVAPPVARAIPAAPATPTVAPPVVATPAQVGGPSLESRDAAYIPPSSASGFEGGDIATAATPGTNAAPAGAGAAMLGETGQHPVPIGLPPDIAQGKVSGPNLMKILSVALPGLMEAYGASRLGYAGRDYKSMQRQKFEADLQRQQYQAQQEAELRKELALLDPKTQAEASLQKSGAQAQAEGRLATLGQETESAKSLQANQAEVSNAAKLATLPAETEASMKIQKNASDLELATLKESLPLELKQKIDFETNPDVQRVMIARYAAQASVSHQYQTPLGTSGPYAAGQSAARGQ